MLAELNYEQLGIAGGVVSTVVIFLAYVRSRDGTMKDLVRSHDLVMKDMVDKMMDTIKENSRIIGGIEMILKQCKMRCDMSNAEQLRQGKEQERQGDEQARQGKEQERMAHQKQET